MLWMLPLLQPIAAAGIPIVGDILLRYLRRYAEKFGNQEPELVREIYATIAKRDADAVAQLIHKLRERKKRGPAT